jgi:hypothetical protein
MAINKRLINTGGEVAIPTSFNTVTYPGTGSPQSITGVGFQSDLTWIKVRSTVNEATIQDSVRGFSKFLRPSLADAEGTNTDMVISPTADGFTLGSNALANQSSQTYVAWCWKAGGAAVTTGGTNLTNRMVSANPSSGFSIMTYTGSAADGTIEHKLLQAPEIWIFKNLSNAKPWFVCTNIIDGSVDYGFLNTTDQFGNAGQGNSTSTILNVNLDGGSGFLNANGNNYVAYAFHSVAGFSKFGSYSGNGATGNVVSTSVDGDAGFEPAFLLVKRSDAGSSNWFIYDNKRDTNPNGNFLIPNSAQAETNLDAYSFYFNSNNFTVNSTDPQLNASGGTYIYMAFANQF